MKCYYEVLNIAKGADDAEIKAAYRKMALKWHPDKNLDNAEYAKEQFQIVQQAYEVLSDRQERAWYDSHREEILRGANSEYQDNSLDLFQYFTTSCFQGYNDEEKGFYTVYRKVFEDVAKEDLEFMENKDEFCDIPEFGSSTSDYETVVKPFYDYWISYSTKKSYSWLDPIDVREGKGNRRVTKYIEKENKKVRLQAKTERNEEIRNLVAFVRKRDKRVQIYKKQLEAKTAENRKKQEELSKQRRLERHKLHTNEVQAEWAKFDNVQSELEEIEKHLAAQFGEEISNSDDDEDQEEDINNLYCIACNKVFKNPKAFENHEFSKKHKENFERLKEVMLEEEEESNLSDNLQEFDECEEIKQDLNNVDGENDTYSDSESLVSEESHDEVVKSKQKRKNKRINKTLNSKDNISDKELGKNEDKSSTKIDLENVESDTESSISKTSKKKTKMAKKIIIDEVESNPDIESKASDDDFDFGLSKKQKKKNKKSIGNKNKKEENIVQNGDSNSLQVNASTETKKDPGLHVKINNKPIKRAAKKVKSVTKEITEEDLEDIDISHCCVSCKAEFPSKNKLFDHLKKTGHGVYLPPTKGRQSNKKKSAVLV